MVEIMQTKSEAKSDNIQEDDASQASDDRDCSTVATFEGDSVLATPAPWDHTNYSLNSYL